MRGIITCMNCGFHQSWISQSNEPVIGVSKCRKCDRMNRFNPLSTRWGIGKGEQRGRTAAVWFRKRPESMPRYALNEEAISRNSMTGDIANVITDLRFTPASEIKGRGGQDDS